MLKIRVKEKNGRKYAVLVYMIDDFATYLTYDTSVIIRVANLTYYELHKLIADTPANTDIDI